MKNISKTVRLDDVTYNYILKVDGDGFNQKLDNLVKLYFFSLDERQKKIKVLDDLMSERIKQLDDLNNKLFALQKIDKVFGDLYKSLEEYINNLSEVLYYEGREK